MQSVDCSLSGAVNSDDLPIVNAYVFILLSGADADGIGRPCPGDATCIQLSPTHALRPGSLLLSSFDLGCNVPVDGTDAGTVHLLVREVLGSNASNATNATMFEVAITAVPESDYRCARP